MQDTAMGRWRRDELADIDLIAVERAIAGDPPATIRRGELFFATVRLRQSGLYYSQIAARLNIDPQQVHRYLSVAGMTSTGRVTRCEWALRTCADIAAALSRMEGVA